MHSYERWTTGKPDCSFEREGGCIAIDMDGLTSSRVCRAQWPSELRTAFASRSYCRRTCRRHGERRTIGRFGHRVLVSHRGTCALGPKISARSGVEHSSGLPSSWYLREICSVNLYTG